MLGPVEARAAGRLVPLGGGRQLKLFAFLVLNANAAVSTDALIDAVWGLQRDEAFKRLHMAISRLRKALAPLEADGETVLRTVSGGYLLSVAPGDLDANVFAERINYGRQALEQGDVARASELLREALAMWRGRPLAEVAFEDFAQAEIRRLEELRLSALETRIDADLQLGLHADLTGELDVLLDARPTRERFAGQLMLALYRSGRQADALDVYQRTRVRLAEELGLEPGPALRALQAEILEQAPSLYPRADHLDRPVRLSSADAWPGDRAEGTRRRPAGVPVLPTATIGRAREIAELSSLLQRDDVRLVTVTGPGGVGKTRVAQTVSHAVGAVFPDGVRWIELAGVAHPDDVASTVVRALALAPVGGESAVDTLCRYLASKRLLLTVDNFEHVLDASKLVGELHAECPGVTFLTTSREPLNLAAEQQFLVAPLSVPAVSEALTVLDIEAADATALFLAAVRRRDTQFAISPGSAHLIARICAALDGLPLALELAAARTGLLSIPELADRLDHEVTDLGTAPRDAPTRHRTLQATIDWSYRLLGPEQQRAFTQFAVFAGGATLGAAQAVTGASLETLQAFTAKSLIDRRRQADGSTRLTMLETIRHFARQQLDRDRERDVVHQRHFEHYLALVELTVPRLATREEPTALAILDGDLDNLSAALQWALDTAPALALRLAGFLGDYWTIRLDQQGLRWLEACLAAAGEEGPSHERARAHLHRGILLGHRHGGTARLHAVTHALSLYRQANDHAGTSAALVVLARASLSGGRTDLDRSRQYAREACDHAHHADDDGLLGEALGTLAIVLHAERPRLLEQATNLLEPLGNYRAIARSHSGAAYVALTEERVAEARDYLATALEAATHINDPWLMMLICGNVGLTNLLSGDYNGATDAFDRQLALCREQSFHGYASEGMVGLAAVAAAERRDEFAAQLYGVAQAWGFPETELDNRIDERLERAFFNGARERCGMNVWRHAQTQGAALSFEQAITYARTQTVVPTVGTS